MGNEYDRRLRSKAEQLSARIDAAQSEYGKGRDEDVRRKVNGLRSERREILDTLEARKAARRG